MKKCLNPRTQANLLLLFKQKNFLSILSIKAAQVYDIHYVNDVIIVATKERLMLIRELYELLKKMYLEKKLEKKIPLTQPIEPNFIKLPTKSPINTRVISEENIKSNKLHENKRKIVVNKNIIKNNLSIEKVKNQVSSRNLLETTKNCTLKCANAKKSEKYKQIIENIKKERNDEIIKTKFKQKLIKNDYLNTPSTTAIKKNMATVLREGARVNKNIKVASKMIIDLCGGCMDPLAIDKLMNETREQRQDYDLQEIERKHLLGLLSMEDAKLAKITLKKQNQEHALLVKQESLELERQLSILRQEEEMKIKIIVQQNQCLIENVKQAQKNVLKSKRKKAKLIANESKLLQKEIIEKRRQELEQKIELIRQIRLLEQLNRDREANKPQKTIDKNQLTGYKYMYEMSLEQLKNNLMTLRTNLEKQMEKRRSEIKSEHDRQKTLYNNTLNLIENHKNFNKQLSGKTSKTKQLIITPDIIELRKKLEMKRSELSKMEICSCISAE